MLLRLGEDAFVPVGDILAVVAMGEGREGTRVYAFKDGEVACTQTHVSPRALARRLREPWNGAAYLRGDALNILG